MMGTRRQTVRLHNTNSSSYCSPSLLISFPFLPFLSRIQKNIHDHKRSKWSSFDDCHDFTQTTSVSDDKTTRTVATRTTSTRCRRFPTISYRRGRRRHFILFFGFKRLKQAEQALARRRASLAITLSVVGRREVAVD
jgi:hypothetical protein